MKTNLPVTNHEIVMGDDDTIVTKTDLKGVILYANQDFIRISGFSAAELIGQNHNLVRHPDMPPEAFADLWATLKKGRPWNGLVKNRCKNGDYYWVNAYVAPIEENGRVTGYTSMRTKPSRDQIEAASRLYKEMKNGTAGVKLHEGHVIRDSIWSTLNPWRLTAALRAATQLRLLLGTVLLGFMLMGVLGKIVIDKVRVNGPVYNKIVQGKDLVADVLPPPEYLIEAYLTTLTMARADVANLPALKAKIHKLREDYQTRHQYWQEHLAEGKLKTLVVETSWKPGIAFLDLLDREFIPNLEAGKRDEALALLPELDRQYNAHRQVIDEVVALANSEDATTALQAENMLRNSNLVLIAIGGVLLLIVGVLGWAVMRNLLRSGDPEYVAEILRHLGAGNLAISINTDSNDKVSNLAVVKHLQLRLRRLVGLVQEQSDSVVSNARQLSAASDQVMADSAKQSDSTASIAATIEEVTTSISNIAEHAREAHTVSNESSDACQSGEKIINNAVHSIEQIANTVRAASQTVLSLGTQSEQISSVVHVIQDIADQTNLLALNAAIEAARAGEQGRGFAVVADEVRKLAERTSSATHEIETMIVSIQKGMQDAVTDMENGVVQVDEGVSLASKAEASIHGIRESSIRVAQVVADISSALKEQQAASENIARLIEHVAASAEENNAIAQQSSSSAHNLQKTASVLQNAVGRFVV